MVELLIKLFDAQSVSGGEKPVADVIEAEIKPFADEIRRDAMGNLIALRKSNGKSPNPRKIMFAAHADEIGFLVTFIDDKGFIRIAPIGGISWISCAFSVVKFENGVMGVLVPDSDAKTSEYDADKFYIDIGCSDRAGAEKLVQIGYALQPSAAPRAGERQDRRTSVGR